MNSFVVCKVMKRMSVKVKKTLGLRRSGLKRSRADKDRAPKPKVRRWHRPWRDATWEA
jgi:hypothetical protein